MILYYTFSIRKTMIFSKDLSETDFRITIQTTLKKVFDNE